MKHVFVVYDSHKSHFFMQKQGLKNARAGYINSLYDGSTTNESEQTKLREGMQSEDGAIQYYHFRHSNMNEGLRDIYFNTVRDSLPQGDTIDAVVLFGDNDIRHSRDKHNLEWARRMKQAIPNLKILAVNPHLGTLNPPEKEKLLAWPLKPSAVINDTITDKERIDKSFIVHAPAQGTAKHTKRALSGQQADVSYALADGVDTMCYDRDSTNSKTALRQMLGMEPMQAVSAARR